MVSSVFISTIAIPHEVNTMINNSGYRADKFVKGLVHWFEKTAPVDGKYPLLSLPFLLLRRKRLGVALFG